MSNAFLVQLCNAVPSRIGIEHAAIGAGYREACDVAKARLEELTVDNSKDEAKFRQDLLNIAKTTLR